MSAEWKDMRPCPTCERPIVFYGWAARRVDAESAFLAEAGRYVASLKYEKVGRKARVLIDKFRALEQAIAFERECRSAEAVLGSDQ